MTTGNTCGQCRHYHAADAHVGTCRHSPPQIVTVLTLTLAGPQCRHETQHPPVAVTFPACGQFEATEGVGGVLG